MRIQVRVDAKQSLDFINGVRSRIDDMTGAFKSIELTLRGIIDRNFRAQGRPKWKPRDSEDDRKHSRSHPLLWETGKLHAAAVGFKSDIGPKRATFAPQFYDCVGVVQHNGYHGSVTVPEHTRAVLPWVQMDIFDKVYNPDKPIMHEHHGKISWGTPSRRTVIPEHTKMVNIPARPFFVIPFDRTEMTKLHDNVWFWLIKGRGVGIGRG